MGVLKEHLHCREKGKASLFDVSHMGQIKWTGKDVMKFLEKVSFTLSVTSSAHSCNAVCKYVLWIETFQVCVGDFQILKPGEAKLSLIIKNDGGIMDDTVVTNDGAFIYMVVNGACKYKVSNFCRYSITFLSDVYLDDSKS